MDERAGQNADIDKRSWLPCKFLTRQESVILGGEFVVSPGSYYQTPYEVGSCAIIH